MSSKKLRSVAVQPLFISVASPSVSYGNWWWGPSWFREWELLHQELLIVRTFSASLPCGEKISIPSCSQSYFISLNFFLITDLMTEIIYVYLKISLIQKFINYVWFEVKLENDCFFLQPNFWRLASKQSLELCNSSGKTFLKGPTSLLETIISKQFLSRL